MSLPQAELKARLDQLGGTVPVPPPPAPPVPQPPAPPVPPAPQPAPDPTAARARLTAVGFAKSTVRQITDAAALRLAVLDESVLKDVAKQNAANERAFARKIEGLPQDAFDKLGKLPASEQLRISKLTSQQMIEELAKVKVASLHLTLGNPTGAVTDVNRPENYLMEKDQYALSYNRDKGMPNWTSWHLDSSDLGPVKRQNDFRPDPALPEGWYRVTPEDYKNSGYTRGHMTPSGDRTSTIENNSQAFLMTNMIPQAAGNNAGPWNDLEMYSRELAKQGNELYIVSGGYGSKGTIGNGKVNIPERTWKVLVVLPQGENDLARVTQNTRVIAVDMPNTEEIKGTDWKSYRTSVDAIEKATGYDFLNNVSTVIQNVIESRVDSVS